MFYLTTHSTHFIYGYMASDIWLRTIQMARKETPLPSHGLLFSISSKGSFICTIPDRIAHTMAFWYTSRGALAGMCLCVYYMYVCKYVCMYFGYWVSDNVILMKR